MMERRRQHLGRVGHVEALEQQRGEEAQQQAQHQAGREQVQELAEDGEHRRRVHLGRLSQLLRRRHRKALGRGGEEGVLLCPNVVCHRRPALDTSR